LTGLQPNATLNVYAVLQGSTAQDRRVDFTVSAVELTTDSVIRIGQVVTGAQSVALIDNEIRDEIGFKEIIKEEIDKHRHRGTPSKIDLRDETKNQLPGAKITDIDASKVVSGVFDIEQIPILDHDDLEFNGLLGHIALDSFVKTLSESNKQLLGEISTVNLLKQHLFLKRKFPNVDQHFINEILLIPGITTNSFIDFENSTAHIDLVNRCISGIPPKTGEFVSVVWDDQTALFHAFSKTNVTVANGKVSLSRDTNATDTIENFEGIAQAGQKVPGFVKTTEIVLDNAKVVAEDADSLKTEGFFSGKFNSQQDFRTLFTKTFDSARDWTSFDRLEVAVKTLAPSHGSVHAYFVNGTGDSAIQSPKFLLLSENEITDDPDEELDDFEVKVFDISNADREQVTSFVIETDDLTSGFEFFIDNANVKNVSLFSPQGSIRLRYSGGSNLTFHSVFFDADVFTNTDVRVRVRVANSPAGLSRAAFTRALPSGTIFALDGTDAEVEVTLLTNELTITPILDSVELRLLTATDDNGFNITAASEWSRGSLSNVTIDSNPSQDTADLIVTTPINVGGIYYAHKDSVSELDNAGVGVFGFNGARLPISPIQALRWATRPEKRFDRAVSAIRRNDKTYLVADLENNRVVHMSSSGDLIRGYGSVDLDEDTFFPMTSVYRPADGILSSVFSQKVEKDDIDIERISIFIGATEVQLNENDIILTGNKSGNIVDIQLSDAKIAQLTGLTKNVFVNFRVGSLPSKIDLSDDNAAALMGLRGIQVFIGAFEYIDGINHPVFVSILDNGNWIVCNSKIVQSATGSGINVSSLFEFDPDSPSTAVFSSDEVTFSDFSLGSVFEITDDRLAVAGVFPTASAVSQATSADGEEDGGIGERKIFITITNDSGSPIDVESVTLASEDGAFGIKRNDTNESIVASGTEVSHPSTGRYEFAFKPEEGVTYTASWRVVEVTGSQPTFQVETVGPFFADDTSSFSDRAAIALKGHRGVVVVLEKSSGNVITRYTSPDNLFASDVDLDANGNLLIAESNFRENGGRVVKIDDFGNVIFQFSNGLFGIVNDAKARSNGNMVLSL